MKDPNNQICSCGHSFKEHHLTPDADEQFPFSFCASVSPPSYKNDCSCLLFTLKDQSKANPFPEEIYQLMKLNGPGNIEEKIDLSEMMLSKVCFHCSHARRHHYQITLDGQEECSGSGTWTPGMGMLYVFCKCNRFWDGTRKEKLSWWKKVKRLLFG